MLGIINTPAAFLRAKETIFLNNRLNNQPVDRHCYVHHQLATPTDPGVTSNAPRAPRWNPHPMRLLPPKVHAEAPFKVIRNFQERFDPITKTYSPKPKPCASPPPAPPPAYRPHNYPDSPTAFRIIDPDTRQTLFIIQGSYVHATREAARYAQAQGLGRNSLLIRRYSGDPPAVYSAR